MSFRWLKGADPVFRTINGEETLVPCKLEGEGKHAEWVEDYRREEWAA
jgi:hypothetical protein